MPNKQLFSVYVVLCKLYHIQTCKQDSFTASVGYPDYPIRRAPTSEVPRGFASPENEFYAVTLRY